MENSRVALLAIIVKEEEAAAQINSILHTYGSYVIGRMGLPYEKKNVHIISVAVDAPNDVISALSGKLGKLQGVSVKTTYAPEERVENENKN